MLTALRMVKVMRGCRLFQNETYEKNALKILNTPYKCTESDIIRFLDPYNPIANSMKWILRSPQEKKGVVLRMQSSEDVEKAITEKNKKQLDKKKLTIEKYPDFRYEQFKQKDIFDPPKATPQSTPEKKEQKSSLHQAALYQKIKLKKEQNIGFIFRKKVQPTHIASTHKKIIIYTTEIKHLKLWQYLKNEY